MRAENPNMTPASQHSYSVASVSYLGPAYTEAQGPSPLPRTTAATDREARAPQLPLGVGPTPGPVSSGAASR